MASSSVDLPMPFSPTMNVTGRRNRNPLNPASAGTV
jgi:hypothetical protein